MGGGGRMRGMLACMYAGTLLSCMHASFVDISDVLAWLCALTQLARDASVMSAFRAKPFAAQSNLNPRSLRSLRPHSHS